MFEDCSRPEKVEWVVRADSTNRFIVHCSKLCIVFDTSTHIERYKPVITHNPRTSTGLARYTEFLERHIPRKEFHLQETMVRPVHRASSYTRLRRIHIVQYLRPSVRERYSENLRSASGQCRPSSLHSRASIVLTSSISPFEYIRASNAALKYGCRTHLNTSNLPV